MENLNRKVYLHNPYALNFDGSTKSQTALPAGVLPTGNTITVEFRYYGTEWGDNDSLILDGANASETQLDILYDSTNSKIEFYCGGDGAGNTDSFEVTITQEQWVGWHHWAFVKDAVAETMLIYHDEELLDSVTSGKTETISSPTSEFNIDVAQYGKMAELRFWNDVRTATEIKSYARVQLDGDEAGLNAYYRFKDKSGTTLTDETSNSYDGTITTPDWVAGYQEAQGCGAWEEIQDDILLEYGISWTKGLASANNARTLVASPGQLNFTLNNDYTNSGGVKGYYTQGHASVRDGFQINQLIRISYTYGGTPYYKWAGRIKEIVPAPGRWGDRETKVVCRDWFDEALSRKISLQEVETDKMANNVLDSALDAMSVPPTYRSFDTGKSTFPYVFDSERDEATTVMTVLQKAMLSERGLLYISGDAIGKGETLVFENRHHRILQTTNEATYNTDSTATLLIDKVKFALKDVYNKIMVRVFPREIDSTATTVLASSQKVFSVGAGESIDITLYYRDPDTGARIGGTAQVDPLVASTDIIANSAENGSGSNITADIAEISTSAGTLEIGGNSAKITITNNGALLAWITTLQIRGKGIYRYDPQVYEVVDEDSRVLYGDRELRFDMPYEDSYNVAQDIGDMLLGERKDPFQNIEGVRFIPYINSTMAQDFCDLEVGSRFALTDDQSNVDSDYFIQYMSVKEDLRGMWVSFKIAEAGSSAYWVLDDVTNSVLGTTTRLAY